MKQFFVNVLLVYISGLVLSGCAPSLPGVGLDNANTISNVVNDAATTVNEANGATNSRDVQNPDTAETVVTDLLVD